MFVLYLLEVGIALLLMLFSFHVCHDYGMYVSVYVVVGGDSLFINVHLWYAMCDWFVYLFIYMHGLYVCVCHSV